jgi:hypothetical protein
MALVTSEVDICNLSLGYLKIEPIASIETPNSNEEKVCAKYYDIARQATLESSDWAFAIKRANVAQDTETPAFGRLYQSATLPSDFLKLVGLYNGFGKLYINTNNQYYDFEGNKILSDFVGPYYLKYIADVTDVNEFDRLFAINFSYVLAIIMSEAFKTSSTTMQAIFEKWRTIWQPNALTVNGQQHKVMRVNKSPYIVARGRANDTVIDNIIV